MDPRGYPSFRPGETYSLDEIREMHRMAQTTAYASAATSEMDLVGGVPYINTPATYGYSGFWAKVTVNLGSALYTVVQQQDNGTGTAWQNVPGGFTGTAFEVNSNTSVPADPSTGPLVWVVPSDAPQGYQFAYSPLVSPVVFHDNTIVYLGDGPGPGPTFIWRDSDTWDIATFIWTITATGSGAVVATGLGKQYENQGIEVVNAPIEICGVQFWCCYTVPTWDGATYPSGYINDWSVTNPATVYRISASGTGFNGVGMALSGIAPFNTTIGGVTTLYPQVIALINVGSNNIYLLHQDTHSAANNRFLLPPGLQTVNGTGLKLKPGDSCICWYDTCRKAATGTGAWIVLSRGQSQVVTLNGLEGDVNLVPGSGNVTITPSNDIIDPRTITITVTDTEAPITGTASQSFLGADASLTNLYANTALSVTLPNAGTYLVICDIISLMQVALTGSQNGQIWCRLYNNTTAAAIANSDRQTLYVASQENGEIQYDCGALHMIVTTGSANNQIVLQGKYITSGTVTTAALSSGGGTAMSYVQLA